MSEVERCPTCGKGSFAKISRDDKNIELVCNNCGSRHADDIE